MIGYFYQITSVPSVGVAPPATPTVIRRSRVFPLPFEKHLSIVIRRVEFLVHTGLAPLLGPGVDPHMNVRFSQDGGDTWGPWLDLSIGKHGDREIRVVRNNIGLVRNGTCELQMNDPVNWFLMGCWIDFSIGGN